MLTINLGRTPHPRTSASLLGVLRALAAALGVGTAIGLYVVAFVHFARPLHLEFDAAYWLGAGGLLLLIGVWGCVRLLQGHKVEGALGVYLLLGALVMVGYGWRRQALITRARSACARALADASDSHQRIRILYSDGVTELPHLSRNVSTHLSCRELLQ